MKKVVRLFDLGNLDVERQMLKDFDVQCRQCTNEDMIIEAAADADAVMYVLEPLTRRVIESMPNLKLIACKSMGWNFIDMEACRERGISVTHLTDTFVQDVADHVAACILAHTKRLMPFDHDVRVNKNWISTHFPDIHRLKNETVGLVGFGRIAKVVAQDLSGFGVRIIAFDPYVTQEAAAPYGVTMVDLDTIFRESDYVSMHMPLVKETENIVSKAQFDQIPGHICFINSARGGVVNEQDMIDAIDSGKISYAYLDVLNDEFPDLYHHPLANRENVFLTPHSAFYSQEAMHDGRVQCCEDVLHFFAGEYDKCHFVPGGNNTDQAVRRN